MRVAFRTDASTEIGTGHVTRCLTLADALRDAGHDSTFVMRELQGHWADTVEARGYAVHRLPAPPEPLTPEDPEAKTPHAGWLGVPWRRDARETLDALSELGPQGVVVDHYALDARWEREAIPEGVRTLSIDDVADRDHDCDVLLDQNLGRDAGAYRDRVPMRCEILAGPRYALLRPEFAAHRASALERRRTRRRPDHVLVSLGGVDKDHTARRVLCALDVSRLPPHAKITVVVGASSPWIDAVRASAAAMTRPATVRVGVDDMASLMSDVDLAVGAAGVTAWERCCLGLPSIVVVIAENQAPAAAAMERDGVARVVGRFDAPDLETRLRTAVSDLSTPGALSTMSKAAARVTDGRGAERVVRAFTQGDASMSLASFGSPPK